MMTFLFQRQSKMIVAGLLLGLGVLLPAMSVAQAAPVVERISFMPNSEEQGYVIRIHATQRLVAYSEPRFVGRNQLEMVLFNTQLSQSCRQDAPDGPVQAYTVQMRQNHLVLRIQLDPQLSVKAKASWEHASDDLLLGLTYTGVPTAMPAPVPTPVAQSAALAPGDARARWQLDTVVIDAGHGGHDAGAIGAGGLREKDVTLPVALRVGRYLETLLGVNVVYTRRDDQFITLRDRGRIANEAGGKLFISIHANAAHNRSAQGTETYFLGMHKTGAAEQVMQRENSVVQYEDDPTVYDGLNEKTLIEQALAQSAYMRSSEQLAGFVQQQFNGNVGRINRGVKQAGFYVLWGASMPAILVELGFVTHTEEAAFLQSENGQIYLASAIFKAVRDFKTQYEKGLDLGVAQ